MKIAIVGTCGIPGKYGGFETLAENLVRFNHENNIGAEITVYCSSKTYPTKIPHWKGASLKYVPLSANGASSLIYDLISMVLACVSGKKIIILLGVSGGAWVGILRLLFGVKIITNVDGIEWRREKWGKLASLVLRASESLAVKWSDVVISDNQHIKNYISERYGRESCVIAYGGDHAVSAPPSLSHPLQVPENYFFSLCRIEPENNVSLILEAFSSSCLPLVFVGNWDANDYSRLLKSRYRGSKNIHLVDAVYDPGILYNYRIKAKAYVHGHSAGGTNPSLVEAMHFNLPVIAFDCSYNRHTTLNRALYFSSSNELNFLLKSTTTTSLNKIGLEMGAIARSNYTWEKIARNYFDLCNISN